MTQKEEIARLEKIVREQHKIIHRLIAVLEDVKPSDGWTGIDAVVAGFDVSKDDEDIVPVDRKKRRKSSKK